MLHPEIKLLIEQSIKNNQISLDEKQQIIEKSIELGEDLKIVLEYMDQYSPKTNETNLIKCKACGDFIPALERICPSCKNVEDSKGEIEYKLDDLIHESENLLKSLKSSESLSFTTQLLRSSNFSLPLLSASAFIFGWNFNSDFLAGVFFTSLVVWFLVIRKLRKNYMNSRKNEISFLHILSELEKNTRLIELYFGSDRKTKEYLENIKIETQTNRNKQLQVKFSEYTLYTILLCLLILLGFLTKI